MRESSAAITSDGAFRFASLAVAARPLSRNPVSGLHKNLCVAAPLGLSNSRCEPRFLGSDPRRGEIFFEGDRKFFVKGVTYGPFQPDAEGHYLGPAIRSNATSRRCGDRIECRPDLSRRRRAGFWIAARRPGCASSSRCRGRSMSSSCAGKLGEEIAQMVRKAVAANRGHPAIFGYLVGNEISSTMVRWLGRADG